MLFSVQQERMTEHIVLREKMRKICEELIVEQFDPEDVAFIPTDWLSRFFRAPQEAPCIDTVNLMCAHGKMDLDRLNDCKIVGSEVVMIFNFKTPL